MVRAIVRDVPSLDNLQRVLICLAYAHSESLEIGVFAKAVHHLLDESVFEDREISALGVRMST